MTRTDAGVARRWNFGGLPTPRVDPSRYRPTCLGRVSQDPLVFCQGTPRPGKAVCEDCLGQTGRQASLELLMRDEAARLLRSSWQRPGLVPHTMMAARLGEIRKFLRTAGLSCLDIDREWRERFERYKAAGGSGRFVELRGPSW